MNQTRFNKIFCIGMNKTGTSSLHRAFEELGLRSIHHAPSGYTSLKQHLEDAKQLNENLKRYQALGEDMLQDISLYDAYSDIGPIMQHFDTLDTQYPGSGFVFTLRDTEAWVESRRKHVMRNRKNTQEGRYSTTFVEINVDAWVAGKERHEKRVRRYFANRPDDILFMDITRGDGYDLLVPFLGLDEQLAGRPFPHKNSSQSLWSDNKDTENQG